MNYTEIVAQGLDRGWRNTTILKKLLEVEEEIEIPPKVFVFIDRYRLAMEWERAALTILENLINEKRYPFFQDEPKEKQVLRQHLKTEKTKDDFGLFGDKGKWKERAFQRLFSFMEAHKGEKPNGALLRLYANDFVSIEGELKNKKNIPWKWVLPQVKTKTALSVAQRTIEIFLDRSIQDTISAKDVRTIEKMSVWLDNTTKYKWLWYVEAVVTATTVKKTKSWDMWAKQLFGGGLGGINWERLGAICFFIRANLERSPDYSLLIDWVNNEVNLYGVGEIRAKMQNEWEGLNFQDCFGRRKK